MITVLVILVLEQIFVVCPRDEGPIRLMPFMGRVPLEMLILIRNSLSRGYILWVLIRVARAFTCWPLVRG
jgi:hypothetical protein